MDSRLPWDFPAADPNGGMRSLAAEVPRGRRLIAVLLLASAAMDLTRCGLTVMTARHPMPCTDSELVAGAVTCCLLR
jgi:hypothetical protein